MEAYLLLEAARSDQAISRIQKDLACEIIHRNTITLQLNRIVLEKAQNDSRAADEFVGHVRLCVRESGFSTAQEQAMREPFAELLRKQRGMSFSPLMTAELIY
jgi:hypothetical protein